MKGKEFERSPFEIGDIIEPHKGPDFAITDNEEIETKDIEVNAKERGTDEDELKVEEDAAETLELEEDATETLEVEDEPKTFMEKLKLVTDRFWRDPVTQNLSWKRIIQSALYFLVFIFLLNALITTVAFWKAASLSSDHVKFDLIQLKALDQDQALLTVSGKLEDTFLMNYVQFKFTKPIKTKISIETEEDADGGVVKEVPLISFVIPAGELVDPGTRRFSLENIEITFNDRFPMEALANLLSPQNYLDAELEEILDNLPKISINSDFGISTRAFWIPFWFTSDQKISIDLAKESKAFLNKGVKDFKVPDFKLKGLNFVQKEDSFSTSGSLLIPVDVFPKYFYIDFPALNWELRQRTLSNKGKIEDTVKYSASASYRMVTLSFPKQILDGSKNNTLLSFNISIHEHDRQGISESIGAFRDSKFKNLIISLAHNSKTLSPCKGLCKWLSPFEINFPIGPLINALPKTGDFSFPPLPTENPLLNLIFNGVQNNPNKLPTFSFTWKLDVSSFTSQKLNEIFTSPFPEFKTRILSDKGNRNPALLLTTTIKHSIDSIGNFLIIEILLVLNDTESFTSSVLNLIGTKNEKQKLFFTGSSETFLSSILIDPLAVEMDSLTFKPRFRHGKKLLLSYLIDTFKGRLVTTKNSSTIPPIPVAVFTETVQHKTTISVQTTSNDFSVKGHVHFADSVSNFKLPFMKFSWVETSFAISPSSKTSTISLELLRLHLSQGTFNVYLTPKNPILLLHDGVLDFKVQMKTKTCKNKKTFLNSWKTFIRNLIVPNAPNFVPFVLSGQSKAANFKTTALLPSTSFISPLLNQIYLKSLATKPVKLPENWLNWFKALAETTVKISGMRGLTTQLLLEMPQMEIVAVDKFESYAIDLRLEMSSIDLNICRRNQKSNVYNFNESLDKVDKSGLSNQACLMQIGLQPVTFDMKIINGNICGILTGVNSTPVALNSIDEDDDEELEIIRNRQLLDQTFAAQDAETFASQAEIHDPSTRLINLIPVNVSIIDLDALVQLVLDVSKNSWEGLRMSLGTLSATKTKELGSDFAKTDNLLLNRLVNSVGSLFAFSAKDGLAHLMKSATKKPAPPIEKFNLKDAMNVSLDIKSPNRNLIIGRVQIGFPETSLHETNVEKSKATNNDDVLIEDGIPVNVVKLPDESATATTLPETVLVNMQWGTIDLKVYHKTSFLELHIPEGKVALRIHKTSGALSMDDAAFSKRLGLAFRLFLDFEHVSSLTLRRITDRLAFWREDDDASSEFAEAIKEMVDGRSLDMEARLQPYSLDPCGQPTHVITSELPIATLVHLIHGLNEKIKIWSKLVMKSKKSSSNLPEISVTPLPLQSAVILPCIVPVLCTKKQMRKKLSKDLRLFKIKIGIRRAIQSVADAIGHVVGIFVEKLNFSQHPAKMNLLIKTSAVAFGFALNGVEAVEFEIDAFKIERPAAVIYSGHKSGFSYADILKLRQRDNFEFHVLLKLSKSVKNLQQVLSPLTLHPDDGIVLTTLPPFHPKYLENSPFSTVKATENRKKKKNQKIHHIPLILSLQNESTRHSSLLSSLIAFSVPSINLGPLTIDPEKAAKAMKKLKIPKPHVAIENSNEIDLTVRITNIVIPNPLPLTFTINHRIGFVIRHRGYSFIRAAIDGKTLQIRAMKPSKLAAHLVLSKNGFGKLPPEKSDIFRTFLSDLAFGRPVKFEIVIHIGQKHSIHLPVGLDWREVSTAAFNSDKVDLDFFRANYIVDSVSTLFSSAYSTTSALIQGARWLVRLGNNNNFDGLPAPNDPVNSNDLLNEVRYHFRRQKEERKKREKAKNSQRRSIKKSSTADSDSNSDSYSSTESTTSSTNSSSSDSSCSISSTSCTSDSSSSSTGSSTSSNTDSTSISDSESSSSSSSSTSDSTSTSSTSTGSDSSSSSSSSTSDSTSSTGTSGSVSSSSSSSSTSDSTRSSSSSTSDSTSSATSDSTSSTSDSDSSDSKIYKRHKRSHESDEEDDEASTVSSLLHPPSDNSIIEIVPLNRDSSGESYDDDFSFIDTSDTVPVIESPTSRYRHSSSSGEETHHLRMEHVDSAQNSLFVIETLSNNNVAIIDKYNEEKQIDFDAPTLRKITRPEEQEEISKPAVKKLTKKDSKPKSIITISYKYMKSFFANFRPYSDEDEEEVKSELSSEESKSSDDSSFDTCKTNTTILNEQVYDEMELKLRQPDGQNQEQFEEENAFRPNQIRINGVVSAQNQLPLVILDQNPNENSELSFEKQHVPTQTHSLPIEVEPSPNEDEDFETITGFPRKTAYETDSSNYQDFSSLSSSSDESDSSTRSTISAIRKVLVDSIDTKSTVADSVIVTAPIDKTGIVRTKSSIDSSSSSSSSSTGSSSITSGSYTPPPPSEDFNPIRRTRANQFVHYSSSSSACSSSNSGKNKARPPRIYGNKKKKDTNLISGREGDPQLELTEVDSKRVRATPILDTSDFKTKKHKSSSSSSSNSSSNSNSSSSNSSSDTDDGKKNNKKKKKKHNKKKKKVGHHKFNKHKKNSKSSFFTIHRDLDPAVDNPVASSSYIDQTVFTVANIANHARVRLFFNNPSEFPIYLLGANMRVVIDDMDMLWSTVIGGRVLPYNFVEQKIEARMFLAPQKCRPSTVNGMRSLSHEDFLKCCYQNRSNPVEVISPDTETEVSAYIYLNNPISSLQVLDEMMMHDGLCTHVLDSPVSIAIEANNGRPYVLELVANILDQPGRPREFGDPCRLETKCEIKNMKIIPIGEVTRTNRNDQIELYNPSQAITFFSSPTDFGQLWRREKIDLSADFETSIRIETQWIYSNFDFKNMTPGFGFVLTRKRENGTGQFGLEGLDESISIILNPKTHTISLIKNGESKPIMSKTNGAFPYDLASHPILMTLRHRPHDKKLIIIVEPELPETFDKKPYYFSTVFPVNLGALLGVLKGASGDHDIDKNVRYKPASQISIGFTGSASEYYNMQLRSWSINLIMPDFSKTLIFFEGKSLAAAHRPGKLFVQLRDSCGKVINGIGGKKLELSVQMRLVSDHSKRDNYDRDELLLDYISDDDYSIHYQTDTRPSPNIKGPKKHRKLHNPLHHLSLASEPKEYWIENVKVRHVPHYGLYHVDYVADMAGRYEIYLAIGQVKKKCRKSSRKYKKRKGRSTDSDSSSDSSSSSNSDGSGTNSGSSDSSSSSSDGSGTNSGSSDSSSSSSSISSSSSSSSGSSSSDSSRSSSSDSSSSSSSSSSSDSITSSSDSSSSASTSSSNNSTTRTNISLSNSSNESSSSDSESDSEGEGKENIGGPNFKPLNEYRWTRLDSYQMFVPSIW